MIEYNPTTQVVSVFFDFSVAGATSTGDLDIDAIAELANGDIVFSNTSEITIGTTSYEATDVIRFTPDGGNMTNVSLFLDGSLITGGDPFNNVSGVSVDSDTLALSVSTGGAPDIMLGGHTFTRNDVVLYDLTNGTASEGFEGDIVLGAPGSTINALHLFPVIPEPSTAALTLGTLAAVGRRRR